MSLFDYPRIHFKGTIQLNPGTANNDDYAQQPSALLPASLEISLHNVTMGGATSEW